MRKVFIDIGGHIGQSIDLFYKQIKDACDWEIYVFEPIQYDNLSQHMKKYSNVETIKGVAGILDEKVGMFSVPLDGQGATTLRGKLTGGVQYDTSISVPSVNFVRWFRNYIAYDDFVIVKINIEGGEYELMPGLARLLSCIDGLWIKLHHPKFELAQKIKMICILNEFKKRIKDCRAFVYCDVSENPYDFEWMLETICERQK